jgi:hypothetical protein
LGGNFVQKIEDENLSEKLAAEMKFYKIDPWNAKSFSPNLT